MAQASIPQLNMPQGGPPPLPQQGSHVLGGILGNLASSYLGNKLKTHMSNAEAKETSDAYSKMLGPLTEAETNPIRKLQYEGFSNLINTRNPTLQKLGIAGLESIFSGSQSDLNRTELQKNLQDEEAGPLTRATKAREGIPTGWNINPQTGVISGMPTSKGVPYDELTQQRMIDRKAQPSYGQPEQLVNKEEDQLLAQENQQIRKDELLKRRDVMLERQKQVQISNLPVIPNEHVKEYVANNAAIRELNNTIETIKNNKAHFGPETYLGQWAANVADPTGSEARAIVSGVSGVRFHKLAGATGTAGETELYRPFIPDVRKDAPSAMIGKINSLKKNIVGLNKEYELAYGKGYRYPLPGVETAPGKGDEEKPTTPRPPTPEEAAAILAKRRAAR
jgi:hypothetical protein